MGGAVIIVATVFGYFFAHVVTLRGVTVSGVLVLFLMTGLGLVGFLDDYIKIFRQRSLGLRARAKLAGQPSSPSRSRSSRCSSPTGASGDPASTQISFIRDTHVDLASPDR